MPHRPLAPEKFQIVTIVPCARETEKWGSALIRGGGVEPYNCLTRARDSDDNLELWLLDVGRGRRYFEDMELNLPLYALQRSAPGYWLVRAPAEDPLLPAVVVVAAFDEPAAYCGPAKRSAIVVRPFDPDRKPTRAEMGNGNWRGELLECARLLDRLVPDHHDPERFHLQKDGLAHELRRLARWARYPC
jgi:hypothetical protein